MPGKISGTVLHEALIKPVMFRILIISRLHWDVIEAVNYCTRASQENWRISNGLFGERAVSGSSMR